MLVAMVTCQAELVEAYICQYGNCQAEPVEANTKYILYSPLLNKQK
jgi:hypothetical protein